jgi:choline dehydrogenase/4-pyridoxate dehydrogenase
MLSGIGDPDELGAHGIEVKVPLKGVGKNMQDHVVAKLVHRRREPGPFHAMMRVDRTVVELAKAYMFGTGLATALPSAGMAFLRCRPDSIAPDVQIVTAATPHDARPYLSPFKRPYEDMYVSRVVLLRPESRGAVRLASADPMTKPLILPNMLTRDQDWATLRAGVRILRDLAREIDAYIRKIAVTFRHTLGTCKMGLLTDPAAVVDPELRVIGIKSLRVVDASVIPDMVGGNINSPVMMIAERAADLIRGRVPLAPVTV